MPQPLKKALITTQFINQAGQEATSDYEVRALQKYLTNSQCSEPIWAAHSSSFSVSGIMEPTAALTERQHGEEQEEKEMEMVRGG